MPGAISTFSMFRPSAEGSLSAENAGHAVQTNIPTIESAPTTLCREGLSQKIMKLHLSPSQPVHAVPWNRVHDRGGKPERLARSCCRAKTTLIRPKIWRE